MTDLLSTSETIIALEDIQIDYRSNWGTHSAVRGVSLHVKSGESVGIVGESGSGKSTIAKAMIGLLPQPSARIAGGSVRVLGEDVTHIGDDGWDAFRGNPIAMIFQDPLSYLNPIKKIGTQIREAIKRHDSKIDPDERVVGLLQLVQLPKSVASSFAYQLSGGMRQRALIAIALACKPKLLIADEPTTALDPTTQAEILKLLRELRHKLDMSMVLISHDLAMVAAECEYINVMYQGRIVESGTSKSIFYEAKHPYTKALLQCSRAELDLRGRFVTIDKNKLENNANYIPGTGR